MARVNPIYNTFKGGYSLKYYDYDGLKYHNHDGKQSDKWQYTCCYNIIRFCKGYVNGNLRVHGEVYSLHINTWGAYCRLPEWMQRKSYDFHFAFIKQFPFVVFGYNNISKYLEWFN